jgi:hypothetical protein
MLGIINPIAKRLMNAPIIAIAGLGMFKLNIGIISIIPKARLAIIPKRILFID